MTLRVEWMNVSTLSSEAVAQGVTVGEHAVTEPLGMVLGGWGDSSVVVIEGDRDQLVSMLDAARASLDRPSTQ